MIDSSDSRITPWVGRLLAINAVVLLLQQTILTSDSVAAFVEFDPDTAMVRPWTFFTYMFVHRGLIHLLGNSLGLFVFGSAVERHFGSRAFLIFYIYCGIGGAVVSALASLMGVPVDSFVGASGAVLGLAFAFAKLAPDAEMMVFPVPVPLKAKQFVFIIAAIDVLGLIIRLPGDNIAHLAHLGGMASGWLFFAMQGMSRPIEPPRLPARRTRVTVPDRAAEGALRQPVERPRAGAIPGGTAPRPDGAAIEAAEIDRVLDKISASGIDSLTDDERQFLDGVSRRRKGGPS